MALWWMEPGWEETSCARCGRTIWPEGDPDWGLCFECFSAAADEESDMDKPKLCPYRKRVEYTLTLYTETPQVAHTEESFLPCVGEECQMWELEYEWPQGQTAPAKPTGSGHCALAGKP